MGGQKDLLKDDRVYPILMSMTTQTKPPPNEKKMSQLREALNQAFSEALRRGFFGTVGLELTIQDGTIQTIRRRVERIER